MALEGISMLPYLVDPEKSMPDRSLFWQHETHSAVRKGNWKIVTDNDRASPIEWELYDLSNDRSETHDVSDQHPDIVSAMNADWQNLANRVHAKPFPEDRDLPTVRSSVKGANGRSLIDSWEPKTSSDIRISHLSFHPNKGSTEWFEYEFEEPRKIKTVGVYWFDEAQAAASFRNERKEILPRSWRVLAWIDNTWSEVSVREQDPGIERDQYNYVTCVRPIHTKKIRIEVQLHDELSGGVLGCRFHAPAQKDVEADCDDPDDELQRIKTLAKATLDDDVDEFNGYFPPQWKSA